MPESIGNDPRTSLAAAIDAAATTLTVVSAARFPVTTPFRVLIDAELLIVTAGGGTTTWTVTRGAEGTTAAAHASGALVDNVLTAGGLAALIAEAIATGGGAAGPLVRLAHVVLPAPATVFDIQDIPASDGTLILDWTGRVDLTAQNMHLRANNDTAANYWRQSNVAQAASAPVSQQDLAATSWFVGAVTGSQATAGVASAGRIIIPHYSQTTWRKVAMAQSFYMLNAATAGMFNINFTGHWASAAAINRLTLYPAAGNLVAGSTLTLWRMA